LGALTQSGLEVPALLMLSGPRLMGHRRAGSLLAAAPECAMSAQAMVRSWRLKAAAQRVGTALGPQRSG
jgi:hypothetical protein